MLIPAAMLVIVMLCLARVRNGWFQETDPARNELVFEGRQHAYGAYHLRKDYGRHAALSMLLALVLSAGAFVLPWALMRPAAAPLPLAPNNGFVVQDFPDAYIPPPAQGPKPAAATTPTAPVTKSARPTGPVEAVDTAVAPLTPPDTPSGPRATGTGTTPATGTLGTGLTGPGPGLGGLAAVDSVWSDFQVQEVPQFPGGEAAMRQWVQRHLEFPDDLEGSDLVYVQFVVGTDGHVESARAVKGTGAGTKAAAERVVRHMPRWTAARMNGHPVRCKLTLPIRFEVR
jgi:protein TonB